MNAKKAAAMIAIKADPRGLERDLSSAKKMLRTFGADTKKIGGKLLGGGAGALGKIGAGLGMAAGFGLASIIDDGLNFEKSLLRMQVAAEKSSAEMVNVRDAIVATSRATAMSREEILAGGQAYLAATGDAAGLVDMMNLLSKTAQATGAKTDDLAKVAAKLRDNFKIDNAADMEKALAGLVAQGKAGSVEMSDLAGTLAGVAPLFADFGSLGGVAGAGELGAAMQVVSKGFGDAKEAATGLRSMMEALQQNADRFEKAGVRIFDKDPKTGEKRMRNLSAIWEDINTSKLVKDPTLLTKAFGQSGAKRAYDQLKKFPELYDKLITAGQDYNTIGRDFETVMENPAMKAEQAINSLKLTLAETFTPDRIADFASALENVAEVFSTIVDAAETLFGHVMKSGQTKWQENKFEKFSGGLTEREKQYFNANIGPGGALEGTGEGSVTEANLKGAVMGGAIPQSLADKIRAHQTELRQHPGRVAMSEAGAARRAVETSQDSVLAQLLQKTNQLQSETIHAITKLADRPATVKMDSSTVARSIENAPFQRGGGR